VKQAEAALAQARARLGLPLEGSDDRMELEKTSLVKQARAVLDEATANHDRVTKLAAEGIISKSEVDTVTAAHLVAQNRYQDALEDARQRQALVAQRRAELEIARQQLADTTLVAPFDGAIQQRLTSPGEYLNAGAPVVTLVRMDPLRLRLEVPERDAPKVRIGQQIRLSLEGETNRCTGEIKRLSPALQEQNRMLVVEADVPNDGALHPGTFARADIVTDHKAQGVVVPAEALITFAGLEKVISVKQGKAVEKRVVTGDRGNGWVEIVSGLEAGEPVVLVPGNLQTGQPVTAAE
jgi:RND family efflux transporter MFP subunit